MNSLLTQSTSSSNSDVFSTAALIYTRLRRVSGRVIDAMYLIENKEYANHIVEHALSTQDKILENYVNRLKLLIDLTPDFIIEPKQNQPQILEKEPEISEEEIYKAQVSHHYIGALR